MLRYSAFINGFSGPVEKAAVTHAVSRKGCWKR